MCRVYNKNGPSDNVIDYLNRNHIYKFQTVHEILEYRKNYSTIVNALFSEHRILIENERVNLNTEIPVIQSSIENITTETRTHIELQIALLQQKRTSLKKERYAFLLRPYKHLQLTFLKYKTHRTLKNKVKNIKKSVIEESRTLNAKQARLGFITDNISEAVTLSCKSELSELVHCKNVINDAMPMIQGAIGELKVIHELEKLNDSYTLFNDYNCNFDPPIYYREENDHIMSIQADHIIIAQSGVFLIETKNWSIESMSNPSLRSPVKQIRRTGYALFCILNNSRTFSWLSHEWGNIKVPVRNIIVFINNKPSEEFQYVKTLNLKELQGYITSFKPIFTPEQADSIASYLKSKMA
jgi:hypothetical protein